MKKCLIFARTSTQDQENSNQILQLRDFIAKQGWELVDTIQEVVSGGKSSGEREGLKRVFSMAHKKEFEILIFWSLDRFTREGSRATINYLTQLESYGIDWHSYTEQYLSSLGVFKDSIISLLSSLAKQEKIRISERTKAGLERTRRINGTRLGRPKTDEAKVVQAVKLRKQGLSFAEIGKQMGIGRSRAHQLSQMGQEKRVA